VKIALALVLAAVLPAAGTKFKELPAGAGKAEVEAACYACHASDLLVQQRLTHKQWTATVEKMMRWGADVPPAQKTPVIDYLARHFGPTNRFAPTRVAARNTNR
jgi:quinoprotein glucose dehydrogenase